MLDVTNEYAVVQLDLTTKYDADVSYDDYDTAIYDSEDKVAIPWQRIEKTVSRIINHTATITISHKVDDPDAFKLDDIELDPGGNIGIYADEYDEYD